MRILWAFFLRDILNETSYKLSFMLQFLGILPAVLMFFFLSKLFGDAVPESLMSYGGDYFTFVLIGIAFQNYLTLSLSYFSSSLRDSQLSGTLEAVLTTPLTIPLFLSGSVIYSFVFNSLRIFIYLFTGVLAFGAVFDWSNLLLIISILILTIGAFSSLGIFSASFIIDLFNSSKVS